MKKVLLFFLLLISSHVFASHMQGAWFEYSFVGANSLKISLNIYRDCNGVGMGGNNYDIVVSDLCGNDTIRLNYDKHVAINLVCPSLSNQTKCAGGFYNEFEKYTYYTIIPIDTTCGDLLIEAYNMVNVNPAQSLPYLANSYVYLYITDAAIKTKNHSTIISNNGFLNKYGLNKLYSLNPELIDFENDSFKVSLIPWQASSNIYHNQFVQNNGKSPFFYTKLDSLTGLIHLMHNQSEICYFNLKIESFNKTLKQKLAEFTIQSGVIFSPTTNPTIATSQDSVFNLPKNNTVFTNNPNVREVCFGDTLMLNIPLNNIQPNAFTLANNLQNQLPGAISSVIQKNGISYLEINWLADTLIPKKLIHLRFSNNNCPFTIQYGLAFFLKVIPSTSIRPISKLLCIKDTVNLKVFNANKGNWGIQNGNLNNSFFGCDSCLETYFVPYQSSKIFFTSTNNFGNCKNTDTLQLELKPTQKPQILLPDTFCNNQNFAWPNWATPKNGNWLNLAFNSAWNSYYLADTTGGLRTFEYAIIDSVCAIKDTASKTVYLHSAPIIIWTDSFEVCQNAEPLFIGTAKPVGGGYGSSTYINGKPYFIPKLANPIQPNKINYGYRDTVTNCVSRAYKNVRVWPLPAVSINLIPPICESEDSVTITQMLPQTGGTLLVDSFVGNTIFPKKLGQGLFTALYALADSNGCADTASRVFTIDSVPNTPQIIVKGKDTLATSVKGTLYNWFWNGILLSNQSELLVNPNIGTYQVEVINGTCTSEISERFTYNPLGIDNHTQKEIQVYPNPNEGVFNAFLPPLYLGKSISIYNSMGQIIQQVIINNLTLEISIPSKGVYFLRVENENKIIKLLVK